VSILIFLLISYVLLSVSLYLLFPKAGVDATKGLIPGVNFIEWAKLIGRPSWWPLLLLIPLVNIFIFVGMAVDLVRSFGKYKFKHTAAAVIFAPAAFYMLSKKADAKYIGQNYLLEKAFNKELIAAQKAGDKRSIDRLMKKNPYKKGIFREWTESIVFAVFAAAFIRMFLIEAFVIPTPSMEGSLMVGDFLFVSKPSYGIRTPMTYVMAPLVHNRLPFFNTESYLKEPSLDYHRLPALETIKRGKPFVFNWPVGDTVFLTKTRSYTIGQTKRNKDIFASDRELLRKVKANDYVIRPIDKKDHYIKRCVAVAGDSLQIINRQLYINGQPVDNPENLQYRYDAAGIGDNISKKKLEEWNIAQTDASFYGRPNDPKILFLNGEQAQKLKSASDKIRLEIYKAPVESLSLFPHDPKNYPGWSVDNFGPVWVPKEGVTIDINSKNIALYRRIISVYENNTLEEKGGQIIINGKPTTSYTFKQDYFWAMGDNRHNSEDSRAWGFVPHDHIVGKPLFIWFSTKNARIFDGIRFNRMFKSANAD